LKDSDDDAGEESVEVKVKEGRKGDDDGEDEFEEQEV